MRQSSVHRIDRTTASAKGLALTDSALARELALVHPSVRRRFRLTDEALQVMDTIVGCVRVLLDDSDPRPVRDRIESLRFRFEQFVPAEVTEEQVAKLITWVEQNFEAETKKWTTWISTTGGKKFWLRLVGTARYERLTQALATDSALLVVATRRALRLGLPLAVALDDCLEIVPPGQRAELGSLAAIEKGLLHMAYGMDALLDRIVDKTGIPLQDALVRDDELSALTIDVGEIVNRLRDLLTAESMERVGALSDTLSRKLKGYEDALTYSADGVSQAASSLIEFVDRLLRDAFTEAEVLDWVSNNRPGDTSYVYVKEGVARPTKRAQAMCFALAGKKPEGDGALETAVTLSLIEARSQAQKLKHRDSSTDDERELLHALMRATRGYVVFTLRASWGVADPARLEGLRVRLAA